jgi:glycine/D-amino acid oxidase-like deaminating enzyme
MREQYNTIVIGGGFYGCILALAFARSGQRVAVLEREAELMTRASYVNQARVHNGYHYPRSYLTALRSAANFPHFVADFRDCIDTGFDHVYAIARANSKVSANQFRRFCSLIGVPLRQIPQGIRTLLNLDLIEDAFCVTEYAFDALALRLGVREKLENAGVEVLCGNAVDRISPEQHDRVWVRLEEGNCLLADRVLSCIYSSTNKLLCRSGLAPLSLKHELAEVALIAVPDMLTRVGFTVMDGPFFSTIPFPARRCHSLTHVRYTPHQSWCDYEPGQYECSPREASTRYMHMLRDAQRYVPALQYARYQESLFEVKSVLMQNEIDDGRPILFRKDHSIKNFSIVMGAKIDNIYDALTALEAAGLLKEVTHGAYV